MNPTPHTTSYYIDLNAGSKENLDIVTDIVGSADINADGETLLATINTADGLKINHYQLLIIANAAANTQMKLEFVVKYDRADNPAFTDILVLDKQRIQYQGVGESSDLDGKRTTIYDKEPTFLTYTGSTAHTIGTKLARYNFVFEPPATTKEALGIHQNYRIYVKCSNYVAGTCSTQLTTVRNVPFVINR